MAITVENYTVKVTFRNTKLTPTIIVQIVTVTQQLRNYYTTSIEKHIYTNYVENAKSQCPGSSSSSTSGLTSHEQVRLLFDLQA